MKSLHKGLDRIEKHLDVIFQVRKFVQLSQFLKQNTKWKEFKRRIRLCVISEQSSQESSPSETEWQSVIDTQTKQGNF